MGSCSTRIKMFRTLIVIYVVFIYSSCVSYDSGFLWNIYKRSHFKSIIKFEDRILQENDNILSVNVLDGGMFDTKITLLIIFNDNQWIELTHIKKNSMKNTMINPLVHSLNGYNITRYYRILDDKDAVVTRGSADVARIIIGRFEVTVNEIIENFEKLSLYINDLDELPDEIDRSKNYDWFWSDEFASKKRIVGNLELIDFKNAYSIGIVLGYRQKGDPPSGDPWYQEEKEKWRQRLRREVQTK